MSEYPETGMQETQAKAELSSLEGGQQLPLFNRLEHKDSQMEDQVYPEQPQEGQRRLYETIRRDLGAL